MSKCNEKIIKEAINATLEQRTRRQFIQAGLMGLGGAAISTVLGGCNSAVPAYESISSAMANQTMKKIAHFAPKAKSIIYLHMAGAPSQLELFDYKPLLTELDGKPCPPSLLEGKKFAFIRGTPKMLGPQAKFAQHGDSGAWISDMLPMHSEIADDITFLKGVSTDQFNHAPAQLLMHTGSARLGRPSMGSWVTYGLGTMNEDLPSYVVLTSGGNNPSAGKSVWGSGFLPSVYQGVQCRSEGDPILFLQDPKGISRDLRRASIDAINKVNQSTYEDYGDPETLSRIEQYELAYRMQISVPEVMDITQEPDYIHEMYGTQPGKESFANNALLARKLVEQGVRFVQLFDWGWDSHGTAEDTALDIGFAQKCNEIDRPINALIRDLKQRGLLDDVLVVWGGEFGRTPMAENREGTDNAFKGRDHHAEAFTMWMAGGGINPGLTYGATDEIGYYATEGKVSTYDVQATILHQMGLNHEELTYQFQGRSFRLTDVEGHVIRDII